MNYQGEPSFQFYIFNSPPQFPLTLQQIFNAFQMTFGVEEIFAPGIRSVFTHDECQNAIPNKQNDCERCIVFRETTCKAYNESMFQPKDEHLQTVVWPFPTNPLP